MNSRIRREITIAAILTLPLLIVAYQGLKDSGWSHSHEITTEHMENVLAKLGAQVDREKVANESSSQSKVSNQVVRIRGVTLQGEHVTDATLDQMKGFTFESLMLNQTSVTDEGLAKLKHLPNLKRLFLRTMHIAGPGLAYLQDLASLRYLELHSAPITDDLLAHLESMKNLEGVSLEMIEKITDAGLTHLNGLTKLRKLNL